MSMSIIWQPQDGPQTQFCASPVFEVFYGGAAGGGKSDGLLMDGLRQIHIPQYRAILFRRTIKQLRKLVDRSQEVFRRAIPGAEWSESKLTWTFPSGAKYMLFHMEEEKNKFDHDGQEYHWIGFDELTHFTETQYKYLYSRSRTANPAIKCYIRASGMPMGAGISWVRQRFIDGGAFKVIKDAESGLERVFIPSTLDDNRILTAADPAYDNRLKMMGPKLYRALRKGDWTVVEGAAFEELDRDTHACRPHLPPRGVTTWCVMDWGYAKPFSLGWYYETYDKQIIRFHEWYGCTGQADKGLRMGARQVAQGIKNYEQNANLQMTYRIADPSIWNKDDEENSIFENMRDENIFFEPANNDRIQGKMEFHNRLALECGQPTFKVTDDCHHFWRTIPLLQPDVRRPEDVDSKMEDHCLHGDTNVITDEGVIPIRNLIGKTGKVLSLEGKLESFVNCRKTKKNADIVRVVFDDGRFVECTPNHKFLTENGWIEAKDLMNYVINDSISYLIKMLPLNALSAENHEHLINTVSGKPVRFIARKDYKNPKVISIIFSGHADVYCLDVPTTHAFAVADGIIVHNCYDEVRYSLMSRPTMRKGGPVEYGEDCVTSRMDWGESVHASTY